jgi:hypothetical protein
MLFDLRGRGRRRTVQAVYLGLAILIGGGLVLFGVGTGTGGGGLLNGLGGNGSNNQSSVVSAQETQALKVVKADPNSPAAWSQLVQARYEAAGQSNNYNSSTGLFTASGKKELVGVTQAWQRYLQLTKTPDPTLALFAAHAYGRLGDYASQAAAWQIITGANPTQATAFQCLAVSAYAAKQTRVGDLALGKALSLAPKAERSTLKTQLSAAKTQPALAQEC